MRFIGILLSLVMMFQIETAYAKKAKAGDKFPLKVVAEMKDLGGGRKPASQLNLNELKGKVVLVDFWASWCEPCKKALPAYEALYKKYGKKGLVVVGVNVDDEAKAGLGFLKQNKVSFPMVYDAGKKLVGQMGVETMPTSYLIDQKGNIKVVHQGFRHGDEVKVEREIASLLKK